MQHARTESSAKVEELMSESLTLGPPNVSMEGKSPAQIRRAGRCLSHKALARILRAKRKQDAAQRIPFSGVEGLLPNWTWDKLVASAVSRPIMLWPKWLVAMSLRLSRRNEYAKNH